MIITDKTLLEQVRTATVSDIKIGEVFSTILMPHKRYLRVADMSNIYKGKKVIDLEDCRATSIMETVFIDRIFKTELIIK